MKWRIAAAMLLASRAAAADEAAVFDEQALVRYALAHNPNVRAARSDEQIARAGITTATTLANPVVRGEWLHVQSSADYGWGVGASWRPPQPGVFGAHGDAARARATAAEADVLEDSADVEAAVRVGYAQTSALGEEIELAKKSVDTRRRIREVIEHRVAQGASSRIDLSLVSIALARSEQEQGALELARTTALARLATTVGWPAGAPLVLAPAPPIDTVAAANAPAPGADVMARPAIRAGLARVEAADQTLSAERAKRYPWLELQVRYREHDQSTYPHDVTLGLDLTVPLLDHNTGPIDAATAAVVKAREAAEANRTAIARDLEALRIENARRAELAEHYAKTIAPILREHQELVKQALSGLEVDVTALLAADDAVTRGGLELIETRLAQRSAQIGYVRAAGGYGR